MEAFIAPAATAGPITLAANSRRRSTFGSLNCATSPAEPVVGTAGDFESVLLLDFPDDDALDDGPADALEDFLRALRRSATLLLPRAGGAGLGPSLESRAVTPHPGWGAGRHRRAYPVR